MYATTALRMLVTASRVDRELIQGSIKGLEHGEFCKVQK